jgi:hypothetical protein
MMAVINDGKIVEFGPAENIYRVDMDASERRPVHRTVILSRHLLPAGKL